MLRKTLLLGLVLLLVQTSFGQDVFRKGKTGINIGGGYRMLGVPALGGNLSLERSVFKSKELGYIGLGLNSDVLFTDEIIPSATLRIILHPNFFRTKTWDIYTGAGLAFAQRETTDGTYLYPDIFLGFRYMVKKRKFGLFSELSLYGANLKAGICFVL